MDDDYNIRSGPGLPKDSNSTYKKNGTNEDAGHVDSHDSVEQQDGDKWEDILGTGAILKKVIEPGDAGDLDMEAPRRFFAFIDIETRLHENQKKLDSESHKNFAISVDSDLFPAVTIVIPLMNIGEVSEFIFKPRFAYGEKGNMPDVPPDSTLECTIRLISRYASEDYSENQLPKMDMKQRLSIANRKRERGNFWFTRGELQFAIESYKSSVVHLEEILDEEELVRYAEFDKVDHGEQTDEDSIKRDIAIAMVSSKNNLAACYIKTEQFKKAQAAVERALEISPSNIKSLYRKSTVESNMGKFEEALATLSKILQLDPENKPAKSSYDQLYKKQRKQSEDERKMYKRMFTPEKKPLGGLNGGGRQGKGKKSVDGQSANIGKYGVIGAAIFAVASAILYTQSSLLSKYF